LATDRVWGGDGLPTCRLTRKTGYRWRAAAGGVIPDRLFEAVRSHRYLSMTERQRIDSLHQHDVGCQ
jgi:hypothetical protein